jgi:hypothetical protein
MTRGRRYAYDEAIAKFDRVIELDKTRWLATSTSPAAT